MADATDLKSVGDKHREGSSPSSSTNLINADIAQW